MTYDKELLDLPHPHSCDTNLTTWDIMAWPEHSFTLVHLYSVQRQNHSIQFK